MSAAAEASEAALVPLLEEHVFSARMMDVDVHFRVLRYSSGAAWVWIGDDSQRMESITAAVETPFDRVPSSTPLMGAENEFETALSKRLAKRLHAPVFVSCNLTRTAGNQQVEEFVELVLQRELRRLGILPGAAPPPPAPPSTVSAAADAE